MRTAILLASAIAFMGTGAALAENASGQKPAAKAVKPDEQKASRAVRLSDAELDKITAGTTVRIIGDGFTIVLNPGHAGVLKVNNNRFICISC